MSITSHTKTMSLTAMALASLVMTLPTAAASETADDFPESGVRTITQATEARAFMDGAEYISYDVGTDSGTSKAHLITVDLKVAETGLLSAPKVASNQRLDTMGYDAGALAAINADFFQNTTDKAHGDIAPTGAAVGVTLADGKIIKSSVPEAQRHGGTMPNPTNVGTEVIGAQRNGTGVVTRVNLDAFIASDALGGKIPLNGLNIYGMATNEITAFDHHWGSASRARAACGDEKRRTTPCTTDIHEVILTDGVVTAISETLGSGQLAENQVALVGREDGAAALRQLELGDEVGYNFRGVAENNKKLDWAVAGGIVLLDGALEKDMSSPNNPRTFGGVSADGNTMYLLAVDGRDNVSSGVRTREGADIIRHLGADDALLLDGGGSSTMLLRESVEADFELMNRSRTSGIEVLRYIPNGIGVFQK